MGNRKRHSVNISQFKKPQIELLMRKARQRDICVSHLQLENIWCRHVVCPMAVVFYAVVNIDAGLRAKHLLYSDSDLALRCLGICWRNIESSEEGTRKH